MKNFDVIIIGGGVAGISAALWCDELGLSSILLEAKSELGGQLLWTYNEIKNHLGSEAENGTELRNKFVRQMQNRKFELELDAEISAIETTKKVVNLGNKKSFSAQNIIIATGVKRRKLGIAGEKRFLNKGILESGKRDRHLVKDKKVLIVGGGDAALENSLILSEFASKVYVLHRRREFRARAEFIKPAKHHERVEFIFESVLRKIGGNEKVEYVEIENTGNAEIDELPIDAVLFRIGVEPNTSFLDGKVKLDESGYIKVDESCKTDCAGIYAVGDVANLVSPTISSAVGMGATAVKVIQSESQQY